MADLLFSINAVLPIFLVMLVGFLLRWRGFIGESFVDGSTKVMFNVALPCMLFRNITRGELNEAFDLKLCLVCVLGTILFVLLLRLVIPRIYQEKAVYTAFIQGVFRTNYALLGMALLSNLGGELGMQKGSVVLAIMIPLYNVLAVLVLSENDQAGDKGQHKLMRRIITNPLIIACAVAVLFSLSGLTLPNMLAEPLGYFADMAMPLALFTLGASINLATDRDRLKPALFAASLRLLLAPVLFLGASVLLGLRNAELAVVLALVSGPSAVTGFPMAHQMGADHHLSAMIIVVTTGFAAFTMVGVVYLTRVLGLIV